MPSDTKNVQLGVCNVNFGGIDLGYTKGGVDVEVKTETKKVMVDQFGNSEINEFILSRSCTAKVPLAETTLRNLSRIMPGSVLTATGEASSTGTVTFVTAAPVNGDKVIINNVDFTFKTGAVISSQEISLTGITTPALAAAALAAAVNNSIDTRLGVAATVAAAVVTLTSDDPGVSGNANTLAKSFVTPANCTVSAALMTGGADASKMKVGVTNGIGISLLELAKKLILHPIGKVPGDRSGDLTLPLANTPGEMQFGFKVDEERIFIANFTAYPDPATKILYFLGDETA